MTTPKKFDHMELARSMFGIALALVILWVAFEILRGALS